MRDGYMSYQYETEKPKLLTDQGQRTFLAFRDNCHKLLNAAGAVRMEEAINIRGSNDIWLLLACADRPVELGEIREISEAGCFGQHRVFVRARVP